ncbi:uncharacterized protein LOC106698487 isoform X1 [Myotis lucifugus]|uniref:uncharacterized protein LOC106698487 isoform X1 n=1 Tax=Myotis lucifugus TaxID=59463 RepID=UPI0006D719FC|nr:uncharacterized protein LOC106698487 isoform X1 [Myotis lucifugus]
MPPSEAARPLLSAVLLRYPPRRAGSPSSERQGGGIGLVFVFDAKRAERRKGEARHGRVPGSAWAGRWAVTPAKVPPQPARVASVPEYPLFAARLTRQPCLHHPDSGREIIRRNCPCSAPTTHLSTSCLHPGWVRVKRPPGQDDPCSGRCCCCPPPDPGPQPVGERPPAEPYQTAAEEVKRGGEEAPARDWSS